MTSLLLNLHEINVMNFFGTRFASSHTSGMRLVFLGPPKYISHKIPRKPLTDKKKNILFVRESIVWLSVLDTEFCSHLEGLESSRHITTLTQEIMAFKEINMTMLSFQ